MGYSVYALASHLNVSWRTIAKWIQSGKLKATGSSSGDWQVSVEDIDAFIEEYQLKPMNHHTTNVSE